MDHGRQRHGLIRLFICLWVIMSAIVPGASPAVGRPTRPDIVLIVMDDQHIQTLQWMPTVWNEIVRKGKAFKNAMVPTSTCCPSRASLLTGLYAHDTEVWSNGRGWGRFVDAGMEDRTVAVWLRSAGYRTGLIGKYLNSYKGTAGPPGWSFWRAFQGVNGAYYDYRLRHGDGSVTVHGSDPSDYSTDVLRRLSLRYIRDTPSTGHSSCTSRHTRRTFPGRLRHGIATSPLPSGDSTLRASMRRTSATSHPGSSGSLSLTSRTSTESEWGSIARSARSMMRCGPSWSSSADGPASGTRSSSSCRTTGRCGVSIE